MIDTFTASQGLTLEDLKKLIDSWVEDGWGEMILVIKDERSNSYHANTIAFLDEEVVIS